MMNTDCRKLLSLLFLVFALTITAAAQDARRFETFGGYSFSYESQLSHPANILPSSSFSGWDTSTTVFLNRWFGFTSDFSGHYGSGTLTLAVVNGTPITVKESVSSYSYLFGPHFTYRHRRYAPFAQTLVGIHNPHRSYSDFSCAPEICGTLPSGSYNRFAMALGGGVDIALGHSISLRPVQAEYLMQREPAVEFSNGNLDYIGVNHGTFRYSAGVTFHFGSHLDGRK
jgi:hypothetical protein